MEPRAFRSRTLLLLLLLLFLEERPAVVLVVDDDSLDKSDGVNIMTFCDRSTLIGFLVKPSPGDWRRSGTLGGSLDKTGTEDEADMEVAVVDVKLP